ncbi:MAG: alkaline phosphatase, partial [Candidatus Thorarchaeota archaeon]
MLTASGSIAYGTSIDIHSLSQDNNLSIILMIGDGMGFDHVKLGRWVEVGSNGNLTMEQLPWNASVTTYSTSSAVTDSAAAATALATGYKTDNGKLSVNPAMMELETILEIAQFLEKSTGLVSTVQIQHATPAAFMAHVSNRNSYTEITRQIVEEAGVDVLLGGGRQYFSESQLNTMESNGYAIAENRTALANVTSGKVLGLFGSVEIEYELDRNFTTTPSLGEMTDKAIELLSVDSDGFFLMVEGGKIDWSAHNNDRVGAALELIAFNDAVQNALNY